MSKPEEIHLFIPGPAGAEPAVLEALARPIRAHYGPDFVARYNRVREQLRQVFCTRNDLFLIVGPGTAALDAAFASALPDGAKVVVPVNGWFGNRLVQMCRAHRAQVEVVEFELGSVIDPDVVAERLRAAPPAAVAWVHHETSTGVLNPVAPIARAAREVGAVSIIDAVSSLGGAPLHVDDWCVDLCVSVSNKGLASVPGLAPISVSEQAWRAIDANADTRSWYTDLRTWRSYEERWAAWHPYPTTVPSNLLDALGTSLERILAEGLEARLERTARAATRVRRELRAMGFEMFCDDEIASPVTTAVRALPELPPAELVAALRERYGIYISGGLDELSGKIFRIGHMGRAIEETELDLLLGAIGEILAERRSGTVAHGAGAHAEPA